MAKHFIRGKYRNEERVIAPSLDAIERTYDFLLAVPDEDCARFFTLEAHKQAAEGGDLQRVAWHLFFDIYNWLKFYWYTTAYKTRQLTTSFIQAYNGENLLTAVILARSSLEYAAVGYHFVKKIGQLQLGGPEFAWSQIHAFEDLMLQYAHGTRFNWPDLLAGNLAGVKSGAAAPTTDSQAVNVLTALSHLARRDSRYRDVEVAYSMLSDFAHPNMASHTTVVEVPAGPTEMHECRITACPGPLRGEFVMIIALPWVSLAVGTVLELLQEVAPLLRTWLAYIDDGAHISIDLRV